MSVALLLITHAPFGAATVDAVFGTLGQLPLPIEVMDITPDCDPQQELANARDRLNRLDQGDGVLVLTDLFGATPSNIACQLLQDGHQLVIVSGLNLAMLIRVMNYADEGLQQLAERALSGAISAVHMHPPQEPAVDA